ncbi:hypothetical protein K501DRAFT_335391 [Backusella circina FSU 941]|nr:hypothetical protein K501DRAFT_335391 [Backusella circina FSU 941]
MDKQESRDRMDTPALNKKKITDKRLPSPKQEEKSPEQNTHEKHGKGREPSINHSKQNNNKVPASQEPSRQMKEHLPLSPSPQISVQLSPLNSLPPFRFEKPILNPTPAPGPHSVSTEINENHQLGKESDDDTGDNDDKDDDDKEEEEEDDEDGDDNGNDDDDDDDDEDDEDDDEDDEDDDEDEDEEDDDDDDDEEEEEDDEDVDTYITENEGGGIYFGAATANPIITSYLGGYGLAAGHAEDEIEGLGLIGVFEPYKVSAASSKSNDHFIFTTILSITLCWLLFKRRG